MIDFKTASDAVVDSYMQSQGIALIDPTTIPRDQATGLYAVTPIVAYVNETNNDQAGKVLRRTFASHPDFRTKCPKVKINQQGHPTWAADLPTIVELIMVLGSKRAKQFRRVCANYIVRILGGDRTLIKEIEDQDERLNQTEAGRQFQQSALSSAGVSTTTTTQLDIREREARIAQIETENAEREAHLAQMETDRFMRLRKLAEEAGAWGPQNERTYLQFLQNGMQSMVPQCAMITASSSSATLYAIGPYMAKHHPEHRSADNCKTLGMITAYFFRLRYRPDDSTFPPKPKNDPLLKKPFFADDVTKNGTSQISAKAYETCDQDLIEMAYLCVTEGLLLPEIKNRITDKGLNWTDKAIESLESFQDHFFSDANPRRSQRRRHE